MRGRREATSPRDRKGGPSRAARGDPAVLLPALAHEVRNLLAAIRLSAHLLEKSGDARERARGAEEIERLSAQAGALLAQVRPLLGENRGRRVRVRVGDLLEAVERSLEGPELAEGRVCVAPAPRGTPDVRIDPDALHHALLVLVRAALDAGGAPVRVSARRQGSRVVVEVCGAGERADGGRAAEDDACARKAAAAAGRPLSGRELAIAVTDAVARRSGGRVRFERAARGSCARLVLAAVRAR